MKVKCFECAALLEAEDADAVAHAFVAHGQEKHTWSYPEDREGLMRDLTNAPVKRSVLIKNASHFVLFEKPRFEFFGAIDAFLKE